VTDQQTAGYLRIRSSRLHDAAQGIRLYSVASDVENLIPYGSPQRLYPGDVLSIDLSGSATPAISNRWAHCCTTTTLRASMQS